VHVEEEREPAGELVDLEARRARRFDIGDAVGEPLAARDACGDAFTPPVYLRTINGHGPDAWGQYLLVPAGLTKGDTILRIEPEGEHGLVIYLAGV
jgi:hypothetical protein